MLSRLSKWGRAAAYLVVLTGLSVWLVTTDSPREQGPLLAILLGAGMAYGVGAAAERGRRKALRRRLLNDNNRET